MSFDLTSIVRKNILDLESYSSARDEFSGEADIYLDANENSIGSPLPVKYNRYPDPLQRLVKQQIVSKWNIDEGNIFVGNGSDEAIDLLIRIFCRPGIDNVITCSPTYGMYKVSASINDIQVIDVSLTDKFDLDTNKILDSVNNKTKIIFICSPNNPTGNLMSRESIIKLATLFSGVVVIDEAYIQFSKARSFTEDISELKNIVVLQTFSKAWGLAGLRLGLAFANETIISLLNKVKPPYNVNVVSQQLLIDAFNNYDNVIENINTILEERTYLQKCLNDLDHVIEIYPSETNFLLVKVTDAKRLYNYLLNKKIVVRDRSNVRLCDECLRITVGTNRENTELIDAIKEYETSIVY